MSDLAGQILFDEQVGAFSGATLRIKLEDVSHADAVAREVGSLEIPGCTHRPGGAPLNFTLTTGDLDPRRRYEVRAHLDMNGNGQYSPGDQITTESHPVLTQGRPAQVQVRLRRI